MELPCNEVTGPEGERLATLMADAARQWWQSIVIEDHSFAKPTFYLGTPERVVTNVLAEGSYDRTDGNIQLLRNGAKGFKRAGDKMCWKVQVTSVCSVSTAELAAVAGSSSPIPLHNNW